MAHKKYEPIPVPLKQKLKEFRLRFIPVLVFAAAIFAIFQLWSLRVYNPTFQGIVYAEQAFLTSPEAGLIQHMYVREFDRVSKGQRIASVIVTDTNLVKNRLSVIEAQISLLSSTLDPLADWQRSRINLVEMNLDIAQERTAIASLKIRATQLARNVERLESLFENNLVSAQEFEDTKAELDMLQSEIPLREKALAEQERIVAQIAEVDRSFSRDGNDPLTSAIRVYEMELLALQDELKPIDIMAPFDGVISQIFFQNGSYVPRGEPFVKLDSPIPTHIVGYLKQPVTIKPYAGMSLQIRTRNQLKQIAEAKVTSVGAQIMVYEETLQRPGASFLESGLPVKISLDGLEELSLLPGEIVDVIVSGERGVSFLR